MLWPDHADMRHEGGTAPPVLRIAGVRAGYGGQSVLRDAAFTLHAGECAALLGPNGSGKTTLLRTLSGVLTLQAGTIEIQGRPLATLKPRERARMVAVVPQRGQLPQGLTARQMVLLGRFAHLSWLGAYGREDYAAADRALEETGAAPLAHRRLTELSGGELQRVLLARALAQESPLLLLDELAAGLDWARMVDLFDLLERRRAAGACVLMAVHDCNLAALYATRLMGLRDGNLVFDGPVAKVFTEENLGALYNIPICVLPHPRWGLPQALLASATGPWSGKKAAAPADDAESGPVSDAQSGSASVRSAGGSL
ncbi:MAG TPA: ABC transporter ATP-binding protein [Desulfovibrio sp.]|uniref:ABC transporter ATP-binding protein n=1 Tax=Desulfovibrio sp. TaxID=885 RepID=UPI002D4D61F4|nr:ABC transporter ATP-binding protein [Desulfovibrio sp.]HZF60191.1 ABC transporter ATP-binding protein [Desulfovibrio sp.]